MATTVEPLQLAPFAPRHAARIASWVSGPDELRWLAPSTTPLLTAAKVIAWPQANGRAYVYRLARAQGEEEASQTSPAADLEDHPAVSGEEAEQIVGYSELNRMSTVFRGWWIGHFVVDPLRRGRGIGRMLLDAILHQAFVRLHGRRVCLVVFPDNVAAVRCYERGGFVCMGEEFHHFASRPLRDRLLRFELDADRWRRSRASE